MSPRVGKLALTGLMVAVMPGLLVGSGNLQDARLNVLFFMSDDHFKCRVFEPTKSD